MNNIRAIYCPHCGNGPKRVLVGAKYKCRCGAGLTISQTCHNYGLHETGHLLITAHEKTLSPNRIPFESINEQIQNSEAAGTAGTGGGEPDQHRTKSAPAADLEVTE